MAPDALQQVINEFKEVVIRETGEPFPDMPKYQLERALLAVFDSWETRRAIDYRNYNRIPHDLYTAVCVVAMVFGNMDDSSGTGVLFTRDPTTGESSLYGEYLVNAQGEDVVAGIATPQKIAQLQHQMPDVYRQLDAMASQLELHYRDSQDVEFTVEQGKLFLLQTRSAKRSGKAAIKMAVDMYEEGLITKHEALMRVEPDQIYQLLLPRLDENAKESAAEAGQLITVGLGASPGGATGRVVFTADEAAEQGRRGVSVVLVRPETSPDDVPRPHRLQGCADFQRRRHQPRRRRGPRPRQALRRRGRAGRGAPGGGRARLRRHRHQQRVKRSASTARRGRYSSDESPPSRPPSRTTRT